jgi:hypothetical protein
MTADDDGETILDTKRVDVAVDSSEEMFRSNIAPDTGHPDLGSPWFSCHVTYTSAYLRR